MALLSDRCGRIACRRHVDNNCARGPGVPGGAPRRRHEQWARERKRSSRNDRAADHKKRPVRYRAKAYCSGVCGTDETEAGKWHPARTTAQEQMDQDRRYEGGQSREPGRVQQDEAHAVNARA